MGTARKLRRRPEDAFDLGRAVAMMDTANIEIAGLQRRDRQRIQGVEEDAVIIRRYMGRLFFTIFAVFIGFIRFFIHLAVFVACPVCSGFGSLRGCLAGPGLLSRNSRSPGQGFPRFFRRNCSHSGSPGQRHSKDQCSHSCTFHGVPPS